MSSPAPDADGYYTLPDDQDHDVRFQGEFIAHSSSRTDGRPRWMELFLYACESEQHQYVVWQVGETVVQYEQTRRRVLLAQDATQLATLLRRHQTGKLSLAGRRLLDEAARTRPDIAGHLAGLADGVRTL